MWPRCELGGCPAGVVCVVPHYSTARTSASRPICNATWSVIPTAVKTRLIHILR